MDISILRYVVIGILTGLSVISCKQGDLLLLNLIQEEGLQMETRTTDPADVGTEALLRTDVGHERTDLRWFRDNCGEQRRQAYLPFKPT